MTKYRGKKLHRPAHPKIYIWSHTKKAEIEYFQGFKNYLKTPLLMPKKKKCGDPQKLIYEVIGWKKENIKDEDKDQVWCIFDVDSFYEPNKQGMLQAIKDAHQNKIKIAYINECFELWIYLHFQKPTSAIKRGKEIEKKIQKAFTLNKLGKYKKNQNIFELLLPFQAQALKNAKQLTTQLYKQINWESVLARSGNPATNFHLLIQEVLKLYHK